MLAGLFAFIMSFQLGVTNGAVNYGMESGRYEQVITEYAFYGEFTAEARFFDFIFIQGRLNNFFNRIDGQIAFSPDHDEYVFIAGIRFKGFEMAYKHACFHPIYPYQQKELLWVQTVLEGATDECYIKFECELK